MKETIPTPASDTQSPDASTVVVAKVGDEQNSVPQTPTKGAASFDQIVKSVNRRAEEFCRFLFPNGKLQGSSLVVGSPKGECGQSLKIAVSGSKTGHWKNMRAGGAEGQNLVELFSQARNVTLAEGTIEIAAWLADRSAVVDEQAGEKGHEQPHELPAVEKQVDTQVGAEAEPIPAPRAPREKGGGVTTGVVEIAGIRMDGGTQTRAAVPVGQPGCRKSAGKEQCYSGRGTDHAISTSQTLTIDAITKPRTRRKLKDHTNKAARNDLVEPGELMPGADFDVAGLKEMSLDELAAGINARLPEIETRVSNAKAQAAQALKAAIETGHYLNEARRKTEKRQWLVWRAEHCPGLAQATAYRYQALAKRFPTGDLSHVINGQSAMTIRQAYQATGILPDAPAAKKKKAPDLDKAPESTDFLAQVGAFTLFLKSAQLGEIDQEFRCALIQELETLSAVSAAMIAALRAAKVSKGDELPSGWSHGTKL